MKNSKNNATLVKSEIEKATEARATMCEVLKEKLKNFMREEDLDRLLKSNSPLHTSSSNK